MAKRWYSVSVLSNFEKKIAETIRQKAEEQGLSEQIEEVLVPTEEVIEVRRNKKVTAERRFMPGYVLVRMDMSDEGYHLINSINRVTGFLGPQGRPMPMRDAEVQAILGRVEEGQDAPRTLIHFEIGEKVKVSDGPFEDFDGMVEEVDEENSRLKVPAGKANPSPPVGPALGQRGINIMEFCKAFNAATQEMETGAPCPTVITYYADKSFSMEIKTPPASHFIKKAAKLTAGSKLPGRSVAGSITGKQVREIAEAKMKDLNATSIEGAMLIIAGSARSMGIEVK
eukprot:snap_masked-scaffold358_size197577-processed-gene-0.8 protein:Tk00157 transcript:snap_masked-scaffold358_size197577-processed-gene-0.8-mRNA-1 annotation:"transcription antitermination protein"